MATNIHFSARDGETLPDQHALDLVWYRDWGNVLALFLLVFAALFLLWLAVAPSESQIKTIVDNLAFPLVMAGGTILAWRVAFSSSLDAASRRAWMLIGTGFLFWVIADAIWAFYAISGSQAPYPSIADIVYLVQMMILLAAVLSFPVRSFARGEQLRFGLDTGVILMSVVSLLWLLIIHPILASPAHELLTGTLWIVYPMLNVLIIIAAFRNIVRHQGNADLTSMVMILTAFIVLTVVNVWWGNMEATGSYGYDGWTYGMWMIAQTMLVISPQLFRTTRTGGDFAHGVAKLARLAGAFPPYFATGMAYAVLIFAVFPLVFQQLGLMVALLLVLTALIVTRQVVTLRENTRHQVEQAVRQRDERFRALVEHSSDMFAVLDMDLNVQFSSESATSIIGVTSQTLTNTGFLDWVHPEDRPYAHDAIQRVIEHPLEPQTFRWRLNRQDDNSVYLESIVSNDRSRPGVEGLVLNTRDISERRRHEQQLAYQANHDVLTDLPNRRMFTELLENALKRVDSNRGVALIFLDIDRFKEINDTLGHDMGDQVLVALGTRLENLLRPGDILGRFAGDEFTIMLNRVRDLDNSYAIASRIHRELGSHLLVDGQQMRVSTSLGVTFTSSPDKDLAELVHEADAAMYAAKRKGRGRVERYEASLEDYLSAQPTPD